MDSIDFDEEVTLRVHVEQTPSGSLTLAPVDTTNAGHVAVGATLPLTVTATLDNRPRTLTANVTRWLLEPADTAVATISSQVGETAASPFMVLANTTSMVLHGTVGESDIAKIEEGQKVKFTVQALPRETFEGTVQQVRLQSKTNENVVNYTVVVSVENPEKKLLPGMTARVEFLTESAEDVLKVANAALRFKPEGAPAVRRRSASMVYTLDASGKLTPIRVRTGITDGRYTHVVSGGLKEGDPVVDALGAQILQRGGEPGRGLLRVGDEGLHLRLTEVAAGRAGDVHGRLRPRQPLDQAPGREREIAGRSKLPAEVAEVPQEVREVAVLVESPDGGEARRPPRTAPALQEPRQGVRRDRSLEVEMDLGFRDVAQRGGPHPRSGHRARDLQRRRLSGAATAPRPRPACPARRGATRRLGTARGTTWRGRGSPS